MKQRIDSVKVKNPNINLSDSGDTLRERTMRENTLRMENTLRQSDS